MSDHYTFGDSNLAAERLALVAQVFDPGSAEFLRARGRAGAELAIDLGCGPGYTTELLLATLSPRRTLGVEASPECGALAAQRLYGRAVVVIADVRALPEQVTGADLIYARLLLTHLADPLSAVADWRKRLAPSRALLLEEVESISTDDPVLADDLDLQRVMLSSHGHTLKIGSRLHEALTDGPGVSSEVGTCQPPVRDAAAMFALNLPNWRDRPEVAALRCAALRCVADLDGLADTLAARAAGSVGAFTITWRMRRLTLTR